jgi:hypothetical protein
VGSGEDESDAGKSATTEPARKSLASSWMPRPPRWEERYHEMLYHVLMGLLMLFITTLVHSAYTICTISMLERANQGARWMSTRWHRTLLVAGVVLVGFLVALIEVSFYALAYLWSGAIEGVEKALYFSMVTFTTLGYGDITLSEDWRMLASFEAANGIILFGWTTALLFAFIQRIVVRL